MFALVIRRVPTAFYRVRAFEVDWWYSPCMRPGVKPSRGNPMAGNGLRAFQRAK